VDLAFYPMKVQKTSTLVAWLLHGQNDGHQRSDNPWEIGEDVGPDRLSFSLIWMRLIAIASPFAKLYIARGCRTGLPAIYRADAAVALYPLRYYHLSWAMAALPRL